MTHRDGRRAFLTIAGAGTLLAACRGENLVEGASPTPSASAGPTPSTSTGAPRKEEPGEDVSATEDLMREHGVIRRVLVVYREAATRMRVKPASVAPDALQKAARLIRTFGEDYHERQLEEANIFPVLTKAGGPVAAAVQILIAQHERGREMTEYVLAVTQKAIADQPPLALVLDAFSRMYEEHTAIEDTVVFPAWKKALSPKELDEMGDRFEGIEHKTFGKDGFDDAVDQIAAIEKALGIDLAAMTPLPPPRP